MLLNIKVVMIVFNRALAHTRTHTVVQSKTQQPLNLKFPLTDGKDEARVFYIFDVRVLGLFDNWLREV